MTTSVAPRSPWSVVLRRRCGTLPSAGMSSAQFIYTMYKVGRFHPPDREVLKDISLSFYPGAKIGVIGSNGSGKSSLLRIMAGEDDGYTGEARLSPGFTVGMLEQEPQLDDDQGRPGQRDGRRGRGCRPPRAVRRGAGQVRRPRRRLRQDRRRAGRAPGASTPRAPTTSTARSRSPWTPCASRPATPTCRHSPAARRRRVALCRLLLSKPDLLLLDEPTNHLDAESVAWLERSLRDYRGTVVAITHDRYFLDNVARWILELERGRGYPFEGNYSGWLEQKQARLEAEERRTRPRRRTLERELEWVRMSPKARQAKGKARLSAYEKLRAEAEEAERGPDKLEISSPPAPASATSSSRPTTSPRPTATGCSSRTSTSPSRRRASSASSAPTAPARPRCSA